jgi:hypothetical protein
MSAVVSSLARAVGSDVVFDGDIRPYLSDETETRSSKGSCIAPERAAEKLFELALELGGSISGEQGSGSSNLDISMQSGRDAAPSSTQVSKRCSIPRT